MSWADNQFESEWNIRPVRIIKDGKKYSDRFAFGETGTVGGGGNSGFQALNLAVQFGARRIVLIGFDMQDIGGLHWYGRNRWPQANNPNEGQMKRWATSMEKAAPALTERGVEVVNASPTSALAVFAKMSVEAALERWR